MNLKKILLLLLFFSASQIFANSAVVFMYHRFGEAKYPSTNITLEQFGYQLNYLEENNYNVWHLSKIINYIQNKKELPPKTVALTIDDAYLSTYISAFPMLKKKKFPFTVMVSTNAVDSKSKNYMSWTQMREMLSFGAEFANHSLSHEYLFHNPNETDAQWRERITTQVQKAQSRIHEELGEDVNENPRLFSYPFGEYDMKTANLIKEFGYVGITQTSGAIGHDSDLRMLTRFPMAEAFASPQSFISKLNTLEMPIESVSPNEPHIKEQNPPVLRIKLKEPLENIGCFLSSGEVINFKWISKTQIDVWANEALVGAREKYTCTAAAGNAKWYWYSHLWILQK